jgi:hypothetical protein
MLSYRMRSLIVALAAAAVAGCQTDEIRTYRVDKANMTRLLGAILPHGDSTWFIKVMGPSKAVSVHEEEFNTYLRSLRFTDGGERPLSWTLPEGWRLDKKNQPSRYATILIGEKDALELTVTKLGREGQASSVLANVNRWRNQVALAPIGEEELRSETKKFELGNDTVTVVDLLGAGTGKTGAKAPMATAERMPPAVVKEKKSDIAYKAPEGWSQKPNNQFSRAAFEVREGGDKADVTVTPLGATGGDLTANVNRWRDQLGLARWSEEEVRKNAVELQVDGKSAKYFDLSGKAGRFLGVRIEDGDTVWFVKMTGPPALIEKQKKNFEAFVKSLRFTAE